MDNNPFTFSDRFLPNQPYLRQFFTGSTDQWEERIYRLINSMGEQTAFDISLPEGFTLEKMSCASIQMDLLKFLIRMARYKRILEIGTFVGFSAMHMAAALPDDGVVVTVEKYDLFVKFARENFTRNGLNEKIRLIHGDGLQALSALKTDGKTGDKFDLIFLDAHKERYSDYINLAHALIEKENGIIVIDDVLFLGDVLNEEPGHDKGLGVKKFLALVRRDTRYWCYLLPIGNGMMFLKRKSKEHA